MLLQDHLKPLQHLRELYMLGNPSQSDWPDGGFQEYVIASLPQLELLDGKEIHKSDRIKALQVFAARQRYLREQAVFVRAEKAKQQAEEDVLDAIEQEKEAQAKAEQGVIEVSSHEATDISAQSKKRGSEPQKPKKSVLGSDEKVPYTQHTRREMYMELAEQKETEEARKRENQPKDRNTEAEHAEALRKVRLHETQGDDSSERAIRQCNEGKWDFRLLDEIFDIVLEVDLPRFLDTSLIDVDVHPSYVSIVVKNKLLRLRFPELVHSDAGKAERSKVTGTLRLTLPKAHVSETQKLRAKLQREELERKEAQNKPKASAGGKYGVATRTRSLVNANDKSAKLSDEVWGCSLAYHGCQSLVSQLCYYIAGPRCSSCRG